MTPSAGTTQAWVLPVAQALNEALPRLHGAAADPLVAELITALVAALARGEIAVDLAGPAPAEVSPELWPEGHRRALLASPLGRDPDGPLALEGQRLQWRRWQRQRQGVIDALIGRAGPQPLAPSPGGATTPAAPGSLELDPLQQGAVAAVLEHGLVLLEGGPGTGKTSTVAGMIAALRARNPEARIHLAAPTGKAAARLRSATGGTLPCTTLHRLLESRGDRFGRHRGHPLALDLLVVDEVSMVDMALMAALLDALPTTCRLVLVGDPAQLPPIAPGAVLLELQDPPRRRQLGGAAITLATTYRNAGAIAAVAAALRQATAPGPGAADAADPLALIRPLLLQLEPSDNLRWRTCSSRRLPAELLEALRDRQDTLARLAAICRPGSPQGCRELLEERDRLLVLSPQRTGPWGLEAIHRALLGDGWAGPLEALPAGTPVLCRRNLPELDLANGDVGLLVGAPGAEARLLFGEGDGFWVHPGQLAGAAEPALALTVHKAQGSEADDVIVLLPSGGHQEARLLYTALTRARQRALLLTAEQRMGATEARP